MSTTSLWSPLPRGWKVGPGPGETYACPPRPQYGGVCPTPFPHSVTPGPRRRPPVSTVDGMAGLPFGFSGGDDPDRDKHGKDPDSGDEHSRPDPFGPGGGDSNVADLGQLFTQLGQMFSGAGAAMSSGQGSGPVNYDLARQLASRSIGFVKPIPDATSSAISDAVHLAETWLDGVPALPAGTTKAAGGTPQDWIDNTLDTWKRWCDPMAEQISPA